MNLFDPRPPANAEQIVQIRSWVRSRLGLDEDTVIMISELRCSELGCPPLETMIAVLDGPGRIRQFKLHKRIEEITPHDVDSAMRSA